MLDSWSLRVLVAVADCGSFSAAADELVLTQPAVSRQIAGLERRFGMPLFRRRTRGVTPTEAGATAVGLARGVLAQIDAFEATMRSFSSLDGGQLRLGGFPSVNTHFVPDAIRLFGRDHPGVTVTLHHVDPFDVLAAVREGRLDVALVTEWQLAENPWAARTDPEARTLDLGAIVGVELVPLLDEELQIAVPAGHPLAGEPAIALADLGDERWVEGAYPDCLGPLAQIAEAMGRAPDIAYFCDDWNGKQGLVAGGAGVMVVPTLASPAIRPDLVLRPTAPRLPTRRLYAATASPPFRTPPAQAMLTVLETLAATHDCAAAPGCHS